jgi:hypothetical protein
MPGSLILLPLRIGVRAFELGLRGATDVLERVALMAGVRSEPAPEPVVDDPAAETPVAETPTAGSAVAVDPRRDEAFDASDVPAPTVEVEAEPADVELVDRGEPVDYDAPPEIEPEHVDTGEELVEEVAEPGAEDGAGAQVRVAEPWAGYRELRAADVVDRVRNASAEELAAVELFELSSRRRQTVMTAVQRELNRRR